jgi:predicted transcriptional regulator
MVRAESEKFIFNYIKKNSPRPISTREISTKLKIAWHTADRYCLKLKLQNKVDSYIIGKATAWYVKK